MKLFTAVRKEILEQWRTYRMLAVCVVLTVFGLASPLLAKLTPDILRLLPGGEQFVAIMPPPTMADAMTQYVKNTSQFGVILALLIAMGAVAQERASGTVVLTLVKPIPRSVFVLAKFLAMAVVFFIALVLAAIGGYYYTVLLFGAPALAPWLALNAFLFLYLLVYVALTLLASTLVASQAVAGGMAFTALLVLSALGVLPTVGEYLPGQLIAWGTELFTDTTVRYWPALGISLILIALCLAAACIILERQEL